VGKQLLNSAAIFNIRTLSLGTPWMLLLLTKKFNSKDYLHTQ